MNATVRHTLNKSLGRILLHDILDPNNDFYIGIGKSDVFNDTDTVVPAKDTIQEEREFRNNLQSIKKVEGATFVTTRINWVSGTSYAAWDDTKTPETSENFYVLNESKELFLCLETGTDNAGNVQNSIVEPNCSLFSVDGEGNPDPTQPITIPEDGYVWKYLLTLTPERIFQFLSSNYIPVGDPEDSLCAGDSIQDMQLLVREAAVGGEITRVKILNGGEGYTSPVNITVEGDGDGTATAEATVVGGVITKVKMTNYGSGYTHASIKVTGGTSPASFQTVITTSKGLGYDPVEDLKTSSVMLNIKPDGTENGTFTVENTFRQIGILKNPKTPEGEMFSDVAAKVMSTVTLEEVSPFEPGIMLVGSNGGKMYVNESSDKVVHYHQNETTGFGDFVVGESVQQEGVLGFATIESISEKNGIDRSTGEILYIENRTRIRRDAEQQEDIKVVIKV